MQGKGRLYDGLLQLRADLGLRDRIHFLGFIEDPAEFLANLDMFLLTSTSEGFSIATIQAMSASLPVIVTRSGGPEEIVTHGKNGWLVDIGNPQAMADAIDTLSANPGLMAELAEQPRKNVTETFDLSAMLAGYDEDLRCFVTSRHRGTHKQVMESPHTMTCKLHERSCFSYSV
jgi:glycosyltransferase involved in cell wall biosynthesis